MGYTRHTGQLSYLITYDGSGNITVPASFTQTTVTSSMLKADSTGKLVAAVAGTDFVAPAGLSAYVPTTRTITINGTSYDLSADRSWSIVSGVSSFNTRTGAITLADTDVTGALGYTPVTNARTLTINGTTYDLSANRSWTIVAGLSSFNTRTGDITLLDTDVTGALGYTPVTNARTITINGTTYDLSANRTWVVDTSSVSTRVVQKFTATASQTTFTITGGYTVGMVDVFLNGVKLDNATEFTASNGSTVVLTAAAAVNDVVEVYKYGGQFIANNTLRQTTAFTATAGQTTFTVNYSVGFVDVFYNGAKLAATEFTATNGTSIVLGTACVVNDIVEVVAYNYTVGAFTGVGGSGTTNYIPKWTASGTLGNSLIVDNGTNIGVYGGSNAAPQFNLYTNGQTNNNVTLAQGFASTTDNIGYLYNRANAPFIFGTNNTERMRISASGNVLIGKTTSSGYTFEIEGFSWYNKSDGYFAAYGHNGSIVGYVGTANQLVSGGSIGNMAINATNSLIFSTGSGSPERMRINQNGDIRIGDPSGADGRVMIKTTSPVAYNANNYNGTNANIRLMTAGSPGTGSTTGISFGIGGSAEAYIGAVQNSNTYAEIVFQTYNGFNYGERARINSSGIFTISNQPSFYATSTAGQSDYNGGEVIVFNTARHNTGGHYNTSNGRFTAPVSGDYLFSVNFYAYGSVRFSITLTINGSQYSPQDVSPLAYHENTVGEMTTGFSLILELAAGDYVEVRSRAGYASRIYRAHSHFSGQLLS